MQAARIFRWYENPEEAYYSAWFFFPEVYEPAAWWNVFQFKSKPADGESEPMWVLDVGNLDGDDLDAENSADGDMVFYLWDALNERSYEDRLAPLTIPVGRWVHVEAFYKRATDETGRITVWQDGVELFDLDGVQMAIADNVHWSLNNYTNDIVPSDVTLYADDAVINTTRTGGEHE